MLKRTTTQTPPNFSKDMAEQANKRFDDYLVWAQEAGVPLPHLEAQMRDAISGIEGMRLANALKQYIPKLGA
jgi:hypothetical protein